MIVLLVTLTTVYALSAMQPMIIDSSTLLMVDVNLFLDISKQIRQLLENV